jgi:hypothetical protein
MTNHARQLSLLVLFALVLGLPGKAAVADEKPKEAPAKAAPKWEHKTVRLSFTVTTEYMDKAFNELGEQGWELVTSNSVTLQSGGHTNYVFKRPKR